MRAPLRASPMGSIWDADDRLIAIGLDGTTHDMELLCRAYNDAVNSINEAVERITARKIQEADKNRRGLI